MKINYIFEIKIFFEVIWMVLLHGLKGAKVIIDKEHKDLDVEVKKINYRLEKINRFSRLASRKCYFIENKYKGKYS